MAAFNTNSEGQVLIHYWNYNNFTSVVNLPAIASLAADYSVMDTAVVRMVNRPIPGTSSANDSSYSDDVAGDASDTINAQLGDPAGNAFRARNPNDSMELLFYIPSTGYKNLVFTYASESSSYTSGDSIQVFSYSLDSGSTWISSGSGLSIWLDSATLIFTRITVAINDTNANNTDKLVFRIRMVGRNSGGTGNNRFDNVTLTGTAISGSTSGVAAIAQSAFTLYPNPVTNHLDVNDNIDGNKSVFITNILGQTVFTGTEEGMHFSVSTDNMNSGLYFITIRENNTGNVSKLKFVKQ